MALKQILTRLWHGAESGAMAKIEPKLGEIATTRDGRDITRGYVDPNQLELPDDTVLQTRGSGDYALYRDVLRDDHVKSALQQRIQAVIARPWEVRPGGSRAVDKAAAEFVRSQLDAINFDDVCSKMLQAIFYGFSVAEVLWSSDGKQIGIDAIRVRDRRRFGFDGEARLRLKTIQMPQGELLPDRKFWIFATGADHDDAPYGLGLGHWLYWLVWFKRNGIKFWAVALEKFGAPTGIGYFPPGALPEDQTKLLNALQAIRQDSAVIMPEGMRAELLESKRSGSAEHGAFVALMNAAILVVIIGQTASTQGTPGKLGNDQTQSEVRADIVKADADLLCASLNTSIIRWLTEWNFPNAKLPTVWRVFDDEDLARRISIDEKIHAMGFVTDESYVTDTYGGKWKKEAEEKCQ